MRNSLTSVAFPSLSTRSVNNLGWLFEMTNGHLFHPVGNVPWLVGEM